MDWTVSHWRTLLNQDFILSSSFQFFYVILWICHIFMAVTWYAASCCIMKYSITIFPETIKQSDFTYFPNTKILKNFILIAWKITSTGHWSDASYVAVSIYPQKHGIPCLRPSCLYLLKSLGSSGKNRKVSLSWNSCWGADGSCTGSSKYPSYIPKYVPFI